MVQAGTLAAGRAAGTEAATAPQASVHSRSVVVATKAPARHDGMCVPDGVRTKCNGAQSKSIGRTYVCSVGRRGKRHEEVDNDVGAERTCAICAWLRAEAERDEWVTARL